MIESRGKSTLTLDPFRVKPFAEQPRKRFRGIPQLAESIRLVGQVTPIVVTPCEENGFDAELVDGERRLQACRLKNMRIKAIIDGAATPAERFALSIAANFCRQPHDCIEISEAVARLKSHGKTAEEIAGIFGKTPAWVYQNASLATLHPDVQEMLKIAGDDQRESRIQRRGLGRMTRSIALLLVPLDQQQQLKAARHITKRKLSMAAARNYVLSTAKGAGKTVGREISPRAKLHVLWNAVEAARHALDRHCSMRFAELQSILSTANARQLKTLAGQLGNLCDDLSGLRKSLTKAGEK
jgi:ParB/RepB/Spo0J family partition protein